MAATAPERPVLRYYGGKWTLAPWIISFFPPTHTTYVELFAGAASALLRKAPSRIEVYNDLDDEIVTLFRVLRTPSDAKRLYSALELTPYARSEFLQAYNAADDPIERARRTLVRGFMGHGSSGANGVKKTGFRRPCSSFFSPAADWCNWREQVSAFTARLARVIIENVDAVQLARHYDAPDTLFYVDPPYVLHTRGRAYPGSPRHPGVDAVYRHDMRDDEDHRRMAECLRGLSGMVVLSGYPCNLYDEELFADWARHERVHRADARLERVEVVWLNPACSTALARSRDQHQMFVEATP